MKAERREIDGAAAEERIDGAYRHRQAVSAPQDSRFIRWFLGTALALLVLFAMLAVLVDPLAVFGTGLLPPKVEMDRDYKAELYARLTPRPEVVILGSSRVQIMSPACVRQLTGRPAFNFGLTAATTEDYLAVLRFLRGVPDDRVREILLGVDPEAFQGEANSRLVRSSRVLRAFLADTRPSSRFATLGSDLLSWQTAVAALASVGHAWFARDSLELKVLGPDGLRMYPLWEDEVRRGEFPQRERVSQSIPGIRGRYASFPRLATARIAALRTFLHEARGADIDVVAFITPVHPMLTMAAAGTALPARTAETAALLRAFEGEGLLRYVETRDLATFGGDPALYFDAIHMMQDNASRLLAYLYRQPSGCARP